LIVRFAAILTWTVGVGLLVAPTATQPALGSVLIGIGLSTYVGYAMVTQLEPAPWRTYTHAGLVGAGGLLATAAERPWWTAIADRPVAATAVLVVAAAVVLALSTARRPRARLRIVAAGEAAADPDR